MIPNKNRVPKESWAKWDESAQAIFNEVFRVTQMYYDVFLHPKTGKISKEEHKTIAWNAAWIAADAVMEVLE